MELKSTLIVNATAWLITAMSINTAVQIIALIVGIVYTLVQIISGIQNIQSHSYKVNRARRIRKRKKDDKKLQGK